MSNYTEDPTASIAKKPKSDILKSTRIILGVINCMADKNRSLHILKYLWDHTDEEHPAIITDILAHLEECGIHTNRKTVASDLADLRDSGFDIVCNSSSATSEMVSSRENKLNPDSTIYTPW